MSNVLSAPPFSGRFEAALPTRKRGWHPAIDFFLPSKSSDVHPKITSKKNYDDNDADDVEDVHCPVPNLFSNDRSITS
jgi:hypothetical protein